MHRPSPSMSETNLFRILLIFRSKVFFFSFHWCVLIHSRSLNLYIDSDRLLPALSLSLGLLFPRNFANQIGKKVVLIYLAYPKVELPPAARLRWERKRKEKVQSGAQRYVPLLCKQGMDDSERVRLLINNKIGHVLDDDLLPEKDESANLFAPLCTKEERQE